MSRFGSGQARVNRSKNINEIRGVRDTELYPIITGQDTNTERDKIRYIDRKDNIQRIIDALPIVKDVIENKNMLNEMKKIIMEIQRKKPEKKVLDKIEPESSRISDEPLVMPSTQEDTEIEQEQEEVHPSTIDNMINLFNTAKKAYSIGKDIYDVYKSFLSIVPIIGSLGLLTGGGLHRQITNDGSEITLDDYYDTPIYVDNNNRFRTLSINHPITTELQLGMRDKRNILDITDNRRRR